MQNVTLSAFPRLVQNAQFSDRTGLFASFELPQCFDDHQHRQFPLVNLDNILILKCSILAPWIILKKLQIFRQKLFR